MLLSFTLRAFLVFATTSVVVIVLVVLGFLDLGQRLEQILDAANAFAVLDQIVEVIDVAQVFEVDTVLRQALQILRANVI